MKALAFVSFLAVLVSASAADWKPVPGRLMTNFAKDVKPDAPLPEYPRPQMVRKEWVESQRAVGLRDPPKDEAQPHKWDGKILVPFPHRKRALGRGAKRSGPTTGSGIGCTFTDEDLSRSAANAGCSTSAPSIGTPTVYVNGKQLGEHQRRLRLHSPFDITDALEARRRAGDSRLASGTRATRAGSPRGKQVRKPEGIWYTHVTGIWQTVWAGAGAGQPHRVAEASPRSRCGTAGDRAGRCRTRKADALFRCHACSMATTSWSRPATGSATESRKVKFPNAQPVVARDSRTFTSSRYRCATATRPATRSNPTSPCAKSRSAKTKTASRASCSTTNRYFQFGPLDQGFWPDGLYTAPTDEALRVRHRNHQEARLQHGRKHVKVEPARWYHWCDKLGLLVWQDMPSGDKYHRQRDPDIKRTPGVREAISKLSGKRIINGLPPFPVHRHVGAVQRRLGTVRHDAHPRTHRRSSIPPGSSMVPAAGPTAAGGDVHDMHSYPGPGMFPTGGKARQRPRRIRRARPAARGPHLARKETGATAASQIRNR